MFEIISILILLFVVFVSGRDELFLSFSGTRVNYDYGARTVHLSNGLRVTEFSNLPQPYAKLVNASEWTSPDPDWYTTFGASAKPVGVVVGRADPGSFSARFQLLNLRFGERPALLKSGDVVFYNVDPAPFLPNDTQTELTVGDTVTLDGATLLLLGGGCCELADTIDQCVTYCGPEAAAGSAGDQDSDADEDSDEAGAAVFAEKRNVASSDSDDDDSDESDEDDDSDSSSDEVVDVDGLLPNVPVLLDSRPPRLSLAVLSGSSLMYNTTSGVITLVGASVSSVVSTSSSPPETELVPSADWTEGRWEAVASAAGVAPLAYLTGVPFDTTGQHRAVVVLLNKRPELNDDGFLEFSQVTLVNGGVGLTNDAIELKRSAIFVGCPTHLCK